MATRRMSAVLLAALLACTFTLAAADTAHGHDGAVSKACQLCHAAHVPALESAVANIPPPVVIGFHTPDAPVFHHVAPDCAGGATRAPPSSR
ncbi:MAG: hypothetical protein ACRD5G_08210 [Candidatus Acidiferrales bacterium]